MLQLIKNKITTNEAKLLFWIVVHKTAAGKLFGRLIYLDCRSCRQTLLPGSSAAAATSLQYIYCCSPEMAG